MFNSKKNDIETADEDELPKIQNERGRKNQIIDVFLNLNSKIILK